MLPLVSFAQSRHNFLIKNGMVYYQQVFEWPGLSRAEILQQLSENLPLVPYVNSVHAEQGYCTAAISNMRINSPTLVSILNDFMFATVVIQVKDEKYRVIIKDIYFVSVEENNNRTIDFSRSVSKTGWFDHREVKEFSDNLNVEVVLRQMDEYFTSLFAFSEAGQHEVW
jgi:hypothetical protein